MIHDLLDLERSTDNSLPVCWPISPSPLLTDNWRDVLQSHPDQRFASYISSGLTSGFRIGFDRKGPCLRSATRNHPSALSNQSAVKNYIEAELEAGRVVGPIAHNLTDCLHNSPIGLVHKSNQVGRWRMIADLSFPRGHSANDGVSKDLLSITYARVDDAVARILQLGRGTQLANLT